MNPRRDDVVPNMVRPSKTVEPDAVVVIEPGLQLSGGRATGSAPPAGRKASAIMPTPALAKAVLDAVEIVARIAGLLTCSPTPS
ncbi:MAG: hypothetical protein ACK4JY_10815 [Brevundimonas sp.]|uniref:hypothetical protein n=1 Tax=Brevundimonas sp. TaxID=1871086 RepID=UPI00391BE1E0